jgi:hypothetical protein
MVGAAYVAGIVIAVGMMVAFIVLLAKGKLDAKYLAPLLFVSAVCGTMLGVLPSLQTFKASIPGVGDWEAQLRDVEHQVAAVASDQAEIAKAAAESTVEIDRALNPSTSSLETNPRLAERVERLARIAVKDPVARSNWLRELKKK